MTIENKLFAIAILLLLTPFPMQGGSVNLKECDSDRYNGERVSAQILIKQAEHDTWKQLPTFDKIISSFFKLVDYRNWPKCIGEILRLKI